VAGKLDEEMSVCYDSDGHCSDEHGSDVSVNETVQGRDKKSATSTSSAAKNPKRRRDRLVRFKNRLAQKLGSEFEWDEEEESKKPYTMTEAKRQESAQKALAKAPPPTKMAITKGEIEGATVAFAAVNGLSATEKYSTVIAEANRLQYSQAELMAFQAVINDKFAPKFHIKPKDLSRLPAVQDRYTALKGEWSEKYCTLCKKYFGASHETSAEHISRLDEMTAGDEMIGPCHAGSSRRFSDTPGLPRFLSQSLLKAYWGQDVQSMIALVWHRLRVGGVKLEAAIPGWGKSKRLISADEVSGIGMGAVTYPGSGKYDPCVDVAVRWEDMVADLPPDIGALRAPHRRRVQEGGHLQGARRARLVANLHRELEDGGF
jgi:hypothetical protein